LAISTIMGNLNLYVLETIFLTAFISQISDVP